MLVFLCFFLFWQCIHESAACIYNNHPLHSVIHSVNKPHASSVVIFLSANSSAISLKPFSCSWCECITSAVIPASRKFSINEHACSVVIFSSANISAISLKYVRCSRGVFIVCAFISDFLLRSAAVQSATVFNQ